MAGVMRRSFAVTKHFAKNLDKMASRVRTRKSVTDMKRLQSFLAKSNSSGTLNQKVNRQAASDEEFASFLKTYREKNPENATILDFSRFFDENNQLKDNIRFRQDEIDMLKEFHTRSREKKDELEKQVVYL